VAVEMRRAARVDANHALVKGAFIACGALVKDLSAVGGGLADLLIQYHHKLMLVEVKDGAKSPSRRKLTPAQEVFHGMWDVHIITCVEDVPILLAGRPKDLPQEPK
jgi:hypothetical protein